MNVGINTYGLWEKLGHDFEGTLYELKEQGYEKDNLKFYTCSPICRYAEFLLSV